MPCRYDSIVLIQKLYFTYIMYHIIPDYIVIYGSIKSTNTPILQTFSC